MCECGCQCVSCIKLLFWVFCQICVFRLVFFSSCLLRLAYLTFATLLGAARHVPRIKVKVLLNFQSGRTNHLTATTAATCYIFCYFYLLKLRQTNAKTKQNKSEGIKGSKTNDKYARLGAMQRS